MSLILTALGTILQLAKTAAGYSSVALTVLVAVSNELSRWPVFAHFLATKQVALRRAWVTSLSLYFLCAVAYALVEQQTNALLIDLAGIVLMVGLVWWRHAGLGLRRRPAAEPDELLDEPAPDRGLTRRPRRPRGGDDSLAAEPREPRREPRRPVPDYAGPGDEELSPLPPPRPPDEEPSPSRRRRRRRVPRD